MRPDAVDLDLVAAARRGSTAAFARLVDRHQAGVRAFLRRACGGDPAEADDLAQETFLAAWSRLDRLRPDASVRAWLCGIAYRKALGWRRSWLRRLTRDGAWAAERPSSAAAGADDRAVVLDALAALPFEQRAALALCLGAEFSHVEAAEALGLPLGTVKSHVTRGRARLQTVLGDPDGRA